MADQMADQMADRLGPLEVLEDPQEVLVDLLEELVGPLEVLVDLLEELVDLLEELVDLLEVLEDPLVAGGPLLPNQSSGCGPIEGLQFSMVVREVLPLQDSGLGSEHRVRYLQR
jgi:hypothetical protein